MFSQSNKFLFSNEQTWVHSTIVILYPTFLLYKLNLLRFPYAPPVKFYDAAATDSLNISDHFVMKSLLIDRTSLSIYNKIHLNSYSLSARSSYSDEYSVSLMTRM